MTVSTDGEDRQRGGSRRRSVARLTAVQALYQLEANPELVLPPSSSDARWNLRAVAKQA